MGDDPRGLPADPAHAAESKRAGSSPQTGSILPDDERIVLDDAAIRRALTRISHELIERNPDPSALYLVAVPNGGIPLARRLARNLREIADLEVPMGILDTTLYRDDLMSRAARPRLRRTEMPSAVDDRIVVLVDDVAFTGRTVRAAMDALIDFGRPKIVQVVALVDRGHRELPIKIDYVGKNIPTQPGDDVELVGDADGNGPLCIVHHPEARRVPA